MYPLIPAVHTPTFLSSLEPHRTIPHGPFACLQALIFAIVNALQPSRFEHYKAVDPTLARNGGITDKLQAVFRALDLIKGPELQDEPSMIISMNLHLVKSHSRLNPIETQLRKKAVWLTLTGAM
jgi:hypothetical protein